MKKTAILLCFFLGSICGCAFNQPDPGNADSAYVVMPTFYEEVAPYENIFGTKKGIQNLKYFTAASFKNRENGAIRVAGKVMGSKKNDSVGYAFNRFEPGRYDLVSFSFAGHEIKYDQAKCGGISFEVRPREIIVLKSLRPVAISDVKSTFGAPSRAVMFAEFNHLPTDYKDYTKGYISLTKEPRVIGPTSDNPAGFRSCVNAVYPKYNTLMKEKGAFVAPY